MYLSKLQDAFVQISKGALSEPGATLIVRESKAQVMAEAELKHISYFLCTFKKKQAKSQTLSISLRNGHLFSLHCAKETDKKLARAHVTLKVSLKISTMILFANILTDFICCNLKRAPVVLICFMPFTARESTLLEVLHWRGGRF